MTSFDFQATWTKLKVKLLVWKVAKLGTGDASSVSMTSFDVQVIWSKVKLLVFEKNVVLLISLDP